MSPLCLSVVDDCPYVPVPGFPAKFESKSVPGAIYTCPFGQVFDFDYFPCGCFPIANPTGPPPGERDRERPPILSTASCIH